MGSVGKIVSGGKGLASMWKEDTFLMGRIGLDREIKSIMIAESGEGTTNQPGARRGVAECTQKMAIFKREFQL